MDPLTQGLLGAVTAELGFRQRIGPRATLLAFGAAMTPDLDMLAGRVLSAAAGRSSFDSLMLIHRGPTHSLLMVPFMALVIAFFWWLARRLTRLRRRGQMQPASLPSGGAGEAPFLLLYACIFVAVLTHGLLDLCTSFGTQIFWPLSRQRYALDVMPIIDIFYTPILLLTVLGCWLVRKIRPAARRTTLAVAWAGFILSMCYIGGGWLARERAVSLARDMTKRKANILRVDAYPALGSILLWRGLVECDDHWTAWRIHLLAPIERDGALSTTVRKPPENEWIRRARELQRVKDFEWFCMGRTRPEYTATGRGHVIEFWDMRYGLMPEGVRSHWSMRVEYDDSGNLVSAKRMQNISAGQRTHLLKRLWDDIWSPQRKDTSAN